MLGEAHRLQRGDALADALLQRRTGREGHHDGTRGGEGGEGLRTEQEEKRAG